MAKAITSATDRLKMCSVIESSPRYRGTAGSSLAHARSVAEIPEDQQALDEVVADLDDEQWALPTPSPGWTVADQIGHLAYFDGTAALAITDPDAFTDTVTELMELLDGDADMDEHTLGTFRAMSPPQLLDAWRQRRAQLAAASKDLDEDARVPWYGPSMGTKSFLTARLMEVWAHGQDIVDAVGASRPATDRLRHVAQLGVITRAWSYINRGEEPPVAPVRVVLTAPSGDTWTFGDPDADDLVTGSAEDFCLVVTQRRHLADTDLRADGAAARDWVEKAQAFAGPPTEGPAPRS